MPRSHLIAYFDTLKYLAKGGRIGKAQGLLGAMLSVKPILNVKDGEMSPVTRLRSRAAGMDYLCNFVTGSSIMPQKKNPDVAELVRGKTGRIYGRLLALLTTMKALPLAYNRDMQEDKEGFFDTVDTLLSTLEVFSGMLATLQVKAENTEQAVKQGYILATDLADYLVKKGEAFRTAHDIVARLVSHVMKKGKLFNELSLAEYKDFSPLFGEDVYSITVESSLASRDVTGGTAPKQVERALAAAKKISSTHL
ncbi:unnamed protein product [marine sediment metagenome]|uniref:Argininosuccinate lyase C-terminal domain-containing protein n=1 Tax=marine sediment metagenome TaxID=412755 RepID=X1SZZ5_9ZZZZ